MLPFRQFERREIHLPRPSRAWWRALLLEDWSIKLLALAITLGLWYGVRVEMGETRVDKRLFGVVVRDISNNSIKNLSPPQTASVIVRAPRLVADKLRAEDLSIVVEKSPDGKMTARLVAPPDMEDKIELLSSNPPISALIDSSR